MDSVAEDISASFKIWSIISIGTQGDAIVMFSSPSLGLRTLDADRKRGTTWSMGVS